MKRSQGSTIIHPIFLTSPLLLLDLDSVNLSHDVERHMYSRGQLVDSPISEEFTAVEEKGVKVWGSGRKANGQYKQEDSSGKCPREVEKEAEDDETKDGLHQLHLVQKAYRWRFCHR